MHFLYSLIIYPLFLIIVHIIAIFNKLFRKALIPRYHILSTIKKWKGLQKEDKTLLLIHTSSMGEFEHIKSLVTKLGTYNIHLVITFYSPSGYENIKTFPGVDLFIYAPFDFQFVWKRIFKILNPSFILFSKHETWPNYVWTAEKLGIPLFIINAALPSESSPIEPVIRFFYKPIYKSFTTIYTISKKHLLNFNKLYPDCHVEYAGDTKFDQVATRKLTSVTKEYIPKNWYSAAFIIVIGSVWPDDTKIIFPEIKKLMQKHKNIKIIIAPHELHKSYINEICRFFEDMGCLLYSRIDLFYQQKVILVDKIGILADIYKYGDIAYVGGSFRQGIHNIMEPAIYGIPLIHGPKHKIAPEASALNHYGGSSIITSGKEAAEAFNKLYTDNTLREEMGRKAEEFSLQNTGTADRLIQQWEKYLPAFTKKQNNQE